MTHSSPDVSQEFGTDGIKPMARASRVTRMFMAVVEWAERLNLKYAIHGNPAVYDNAVFPWAKDIEADWQKIRAELERILERKDELPAFHEISTDVATITNDRDWKTFFLCGYGLKVEKNIEQCPQTWQALQKIPGMLTAMFSILEPGKHIPAHRGPYNGVLRLHLGLIVPGPKDKLKIRVGQDICHWEDGKALIFDDAYNHEVWNDTGKLRVVLFVDFIKPLRFPARLVNWILLHLAVFTPFVQEGSTNQKAWETKFYAEAEAWRNR